MTTFCIAFYKSFLSTAVTNSPPVFESPPALLEGNDLLPAQVLNLGGADLFFIAEDCVFQFKFFSRMLYCEPDLLVYVGKVSSEKILNQDMLGSEAYPQF
jgi:hypothetical protein